MFYSWLYFNELLQVKCYNVVINNYIIIRTEVIDHGNDDWVCDDETIVWIGYTV